MATISQAQWKRYITRLSSINEKAAEDIRKFVISRGGYLHINRQELIDYAYGVVIKYGEASATLSAEMYDALAELSGKYLPTAELAETPSIEEVAKTVNGTLKQSGNLEMLASAVGRLVKRTGADTTLINAERDGAQFAWIPSGDTCAFCIAIASRGWQYISKESFRNGHAEHIHSNCDCAYAVRFDESSNVSGYNPQIYEDLYYGVDELIDKEGRIRPKDRINAMRRLFYAENSEKINAQKRDAYEKRVERESSAAEELDV